MQTKLQTFLEPAFANKKVFFLSIFTWLILGLFSFANILLIQKIVAIIENGTKDGAPKIAIIFSLVNLAFFIFVYFSRNYRFTYVDNSVTQFLQNKYMSKFYHLSNTEIEIFGTGRIISILSKGISAWTDFIFDGIRVFVSLFVSIVATIIIVLQIGKYYHIIALIFLVLFATYAIILLTRKSKEYRKFVVESKIIHDRQFVKMIMNKFEILQNYRVNREVKILNDNYEDIINGRRKVWNYVIGMAMIPDIAVFLVYISFLVLLIYSNVPFSIIVSFFLVLSFLRTMLDSLVWFCSYFSRYFYQVEKLWEFFDTTPEIRGLTSGKNFAYTNGNIELKNISFSYGDNLVFENFSLNIKGNQVTAFVGESGGGKTTLMKLISAFIEQNTGEIIIDGQNLREINLMSYYQEIGYLTQEPNVFDGTILENLTYGSKEKITEAKLKKAIKNAKCEFIYDFKNGLNTEIGERGVRLSGGQKQRLAIAKIFLKDPKIIFLDEPTSALDSQSEKLIHESFKELFKGKTVIIIAHRLQTVKSADEIFVIEKGNHESLLKKKSYYYNMIELQSGF